MKEERRKVLKGKKRNEAQRGKERKGRDGYTDRKGRDLYEEKCDQGRAMKKVNVASERLWCRGREQM